MRVDDMKSFTWKGQNMPRLGPLLQELVLVLGYDSKGIALAQEAMFVWLTQIEAQTKDLNFSPAT